jgi:hypothetical protein
MAVFHCRRAFVDDLSSNRHMIRLWLRNEERSWKRPELISKMSHEIYDMTSEYRANPVWDVESSPPLGRGTVKRMKCT